jgi:hypothetical protein
MVISREDPNTAEVNLDGLVTWTNQNQRATLEIGSLGEEGITAEEALILDDTAVEQSGKL